MEMVAGARGGIRITLTMNGQRRKRMHYLERSADNTAGKLANRLLPSHLRAFRGWYSDGSVWAAQY